MNTGFCTASKTFIYTSTVASSLLIHTFSIRLFWNCSFTLFIIWELEEVWERIRMEIYGSSSGNCRSLLENGSSNRNHDNDCKQLAHFNIIRFFTGCNNWRSFFATDLRESCSMDDTTDKYCNYKTTDCTVTSTRDLYKGLNFPKRFECPCEFYSVLFVYVHIFYIPSLLFRCVLGLRNSKGEEELHLQDNEFWLWLFHTNTPLRSISVKRAEMTLDYSQFCIFYLLTSYVV